MEITPVRAICEICDGAITTVVRPDVYGTGANLVRCGCCGFKFYDKVVIPPVEFYNSAAYGDFADAAFKYRTQSPDRWRDVCIPENIVHLQSYYGDLLNLAIKFLGRAAITVYDIGCDYGACLDVARSLGLISAGCEISRYAARFAQEQGFDVVAGDFLEVKTPPGQDIFVLLDVLEHLQRPRAVLERVASHMAADGIIIVKTFYDEFHETLTLEIDKPMAVREFHRTGYFAPDAHPSHFDLPVLRDLLSRTGFIIREETIDRGYGQVTIFAGRA